MGKLGAVGFGVAMTVACGAGAHEVGEYVMPTAHDFNEMRQAVAYCAPNLPASQARAAAQPPAECQGFAHEFQTISTHQDKRYTLPAANTFITDNLNEIETRKAERRWFIYGATALGGMLGAGLVMNSLQRLRFRCQAELDEWSVVQELAIDTQNS